LIDLICYSKAHLIPLEAKTEVMEVKSKQPFMIRVNWGLEKEIEHVTDHNAVVLRAQFPLRADEYHGVHTKQIIYYEPRFEWTSLLWQSAATLIFFLFICLFLVAYNML
jgi:hypothetical protein